LIIPCYIAGTNKLSVRQGYDDTYINKKHTHRIDNIVNPEIITEGARQPKAFPRISPMGIPKTREPLTPIETIPMARPRYFCSTMVGVFTRHNIIHNTPLNADIIRLFNKTTDVGLETITTLHI